MSVTAQPHGPLISIRRLTVGSFVPTAARFHIS